MTGSAAPVGPSKRLRPALDIGGTHVSAALVDLTDEPVLVHARSDRPLDAGAAADVILDQIAGCASAIGGAGDIAWGVAVPGPFDYTHGIARFHGVAKFESLDGVDMRAGLMERISPTPADVRFLNDADAFGLGEWRAGAASGHERAVVIVLGTGIGSAFLACGSVIDDGPSVPPEGRLDLLTIDGRPLEDTVSRRAILARYATLVDAAGAGNVDAPPAGTVDDACAPIDVHELAARARAGDRLARGVFDDSMRALAAAISPWLSAFGATALIVGGGIAASWDIIAKPLREAVETADPGLFKRLDVRPSRRPREAALIGAAVMSAAAAHPGGVA